MVAPGAQVQMTNEALASKRFDAGFQALFCVFWKAVRPNYATVKFTPPTVERTRPLLAVRSVMYGQVVGSLARGTYDGIGTVP